MTERDGEGYYHQRLTEIYRYLVAPGQRVLEIGCGTGDLLSALKPSVGVGVDFSEEMINGPCRNIPSFGLSRPMRTN